MLDKRPKRRNLGWSDYAPPQLRKPGEVNQKELEESSLSLVKVLRMGKPSGPLAGRRYVQQEEVS
jgi:hypothetical protein